MSYSQLYLINTEYKAEEIKDYRNSWLFPIPIFNYLVNKYVDDAEKQLEIEMAKKMRLNIDEKAPINALTYFMFDTDNKRFKAINTKINNSEILIDRIGWELVNQNMFMSKDKETISQAIIGLQKIINADEERFMTVAKDIADIDIEQCPFFIFKNNTIDDGVEKYFSRYNEELDDEEEISLLEYKGKLNFDLVVIDGNKMTFERPVKIEVEANAPR